MKFLRLLLIALAIGFPAISNASSGYFVVGARSCETWIKDRADKSNEWKALADDAWLVGYLSGIAMSADINFLKNVEADSIYLWMDNYCNNHLLNNVDEGAIDLVVELKERKR